jgi:hypothetical protein
MQNGPSGNSERGTYVSVGTAVLFFDEYKSTLLITFILRPDLMYIRIDLTEANQPEMETVFLNILKVCCI